MLFCARNTEITAEHIFPDAIEISYGFPVTPQFRAINFKDSFCEFLEQRDNISRVNKLRRSFRLNTSLLDSTIEFQLKFNRASRNKPLFITAKINPVGIHNNLEGYRLRRSRTDEQPFVAVNNYIRACDPVSSNDLQDLAHLCVSILNSELCEVVGDFFAENGGITIYGADVYVRLVELATDMVDVNPTTVVDLLEANFPSVFKTTIKRKFHSSFMRSGTERNVKFVEGHHSNGIRAKGYEKTNRRFRAELQISSKAFRRLGLQNQLMGEEFSDFFQSLYQVAIPIFRQFLTPLEDVHDDISIYSDMELLAEMVAGCQPRYAAAFINRLVNNGSIPWNYAQTLRSRLVRIGVMERPSRGIYRATVPYRSALLRLNEVLNSVDEAA